MYSTIGPLGTAPPRGASRLFGLEDPEDLIEDLDRGFHQLRKVAAAA